MIAIRQIHPVKSAAVPFTDILRDFEIIVGIVACKPAIGEVVRVRKGGVKGTGHNCNDKNKFEEVRTDILKFLEKISITPSYVIPISAMEGDNVAKKSGKMPWYQGPTILDSLDSFRPSAKDTNKPLRFPIQDVYKVSGKRILVGRVESGTIEPGMEITFLPSGRNTSVKSIEAFGGQKNRAVPGECTGITTEHPLFIERGEVACSTRLPEPVSRVRAHVFWMSKEPFKPGDSLLFRCATQEIGCTIESIGRKLDSSTLEAIEGKTRDLNNMEIGEVTLRLDAPAIVENFNEISELGRFVLTKGLDVSAGGIITEV